MDSKEFVGHLRKKASQFAGYWLQPNLSFLVPAPNTRYPVLPDLAVAPAILVKSLTHDADRIVGGRWTFFGNLELQVEVPPRWHKDYLVQTEIQCREPGFRVNHRQLPSGADIKCIWELSRWYEVARLAQASWLTREPLLSQKCLTLLEHWAETNRPFLGWNWTSALESGLRLLQYAWIDGWLESGPDFPERISRLQQLRQQLLAPHVYYTWRNRSFGSSANNHLIGELAGLIVACVRWPTLTRWCRTLGDLSQLWETQVLTQFSEDGGNREQALNYHLFSWELSYHALCALKTAGINVRTAVEERLARAAEFFVHVQAELEPWDYGDSDSAFVVPLMANIGNAVPEWRSWFAGEQSPALTFWLGTRTPVRTYHGWKHFPDSGYSVFRSPDWFLRWDLSSLGFLNTAAHGHLDVLHLSVWHKGVAMVIDPGTGAYYADSRLRNFLASGDAHNGPNPGSENLPRRSGPFLWASQHDKPVVKNSEEICEAEVALKKGRLVRSLNPLPNGAGWEVTDAFVTLAGQKGRFSVLWQFAPDMQIKRVAENAFKLQRSGVCLAVEVSADWRSIELVIEPDSQNTIEGTVSPSFRKQAFAPFLKLTASDSQSCVFRTTFRACADQ
ncbi:MAG: hypothetical protein JWM16_737 [Verrucomicrobiales bacterium]|nr:hypothetical protein [Verrucomicrobiales bacterium]